MSHMPIDKEDRCQDRTSPSQDCTRRPMGYIMCESDWTMHNIKKRKTQNAKKKKDLTLWCVTMIDPVTSWFEIAEIKAKRSDIIASVVETTWLTRYPYPTQVVLDRGKEFMAEFSEMILKYYGVKKKPITIRNPQANSIIEKIHQTIGKMIRSFKVHSTDIYDKKPWTGILSAVRCVTRATVHTTMQATPMQLVFGRDNILNVKYEAYWSCFK
eukprot:15366617-Ditylum_brightwellii.AAC.1